MSKPHVGTSSRKFILQKIIEQTVHIHFKFAHVLKLAYVRAMHNRHS